MSLTSILIILSPVLVFSGQLRISLSQSNILMGFDETKCEDIIAINSSYVKWPYLTVSPSWDKYPSSILYRSACFMKRLQLLSKRTFHTAPNVSYGMIINAMNDRNCSIYLHGGVVRDLLEGVEPNDVDCEYPCESETFYEIIGSLLSPDSFYGNLSTEYFHIGNRAVDIEMGIDAFNWNLAFFNLEEQEYTLNSLYFDTQNLVIIDLSGKGLEDVLKKQIRIPVEKDDWDLWIFKARGEYLIKRSLRKIPRFWKLKASGYSSPDNETMVYLKNIVRNIWDDEIYQMKKVFFEYLCIMTSSEYNNSSEDCLQHQYTDKSRLFCQNLIFHLKIDFADENGKMEKDLDGFIQNFDCFGSKINLSNYFILLLFFCSIFFFLK